MRRNLINLWRVRATRKKKATHHSANRGNAQSATRLIVQFVPVSGEKLLLETHETKSKRASKRKQTYKKLKIEHIGDE